MSVCFPWENFLLLAFPVLFCSRGATLVFVNVAAPSVKRAPRRAVHFQAFDELFEFDRSDVVTYFGGCSESCSYSMNYELAFQGLVLYNFINALVRVFIRFSENH